MLREDRQKKAAIRLTIKAVIKRLLVIGEKGLLRQGELLKSN